MNSKVYCADDGTTGYHVDCTPTRIAQSGSMQSKLQALDVLDSVTVERSQSAAQAATGAYSWTIIFNDDGNDFNLPATTAVTALTGTGGLTNEMVVAGIQNNGETYISCIGTRAVPTTGGLTKGQLYYTRVFAYNGIGYSDPQVAPSPQKPMVIPSAPTGVTLEIVSSYQLKVIFSPPDDNGGDTITEYTVEWDTDINFANNASSAVVTELSGGAPFFYTIGSLSEKLEMGTYYFVRVKAANSQGYGPTVRSSPNSLNPSQTPSAPTNVFLGSTSPSMISVTWSEPESNGGDTITGYKVEWDKSPTFNSLELAPNKGEVVVAATERAYTIELLTVGTIYYTQISAINGHGTGTPQKSTPLLEKPQLQIPGKPVSLSAVPGTSTAQITVSWQRPRMPHHGYPCFGTPANPADCPLHAGGGDPMSDGGALITK